MNLWMDIVKFRMVCRDGTKWSSILNSVSVNKHYFLTCILAHISQLTFLFVELLSLLFCALCNNAYLAIFMNIHMCPCMYVSFLNDTKLLEIYKMGQIGLRMNDNGVDWVRIGLGINDLDFEWNKKIPYNECLL